MAIFNSKLLVITRGYLDKYGDGSQALEALRPQEIQESLGFGEAESSESLVSCWTTKNPARISRCFHGDFRQFTVFTLW